MDEVCDVACQKQLSFKGDIPICLVNVGGYFGGLCSSCAMDARRC